MDTRDKPLVKEDNKTKGGLNFASLKNLKNELLQSRVMNVIESAMEETTFLESSILDDLQFLVGEEAANTLLSILYINRFSIIDEMEKRKISKEVINFVLELITKFGNRFRNKLLATNEPYTICEVQTMGYYLPEIGKTIFSIRIGRNDGEKFHFDVELGPMCEIVGSIIKAMLDFTISAAKSIPEIELAVNEETITETRKNLQRLVEIVNATRKTEKSEA